MYWFSSPVRCGQCGQCASSRNLSVTVVLTNCYHDQALLPHLILTVANTLSAAQPFPNTTPLLLGVWWS